MSAYTNLTAKLAALTSKAAVDRKRAAWFQATIGLELQLKGRMSVKETTEQGTFSFRMREEDGWKEVTRECTKHTLKIFQYADVVAGPEGLEHVLVESFLITYKDEAGTILGVDRKSCRIGAGAFQETKKVHTARGYVREWKHEYNGHELQTMVFHVMGIGILKLEETEASKTKEENEALKAALAASGVDDPFGTQE